MASRAPRGAGAAMVLGAPLALAVIAACTEFKPTEESPPAPDTGAPLADAAAADGQDAGGDVGASLCASPHALCDDFDGREFLPRPTWTATVQSSGAIAPSNVARSAPRSLSSVLTPGNGRAWVRKDVEDANGATGVRCSFAFRHELEKPAVSFFEIDTLDGAGQVAATLELSLGPNGGNSNVVVPADGGAQNVKDTLTSLAPATWHSLVFQWNFGASFDLDVAGGTIIRRPLSFGPKSAAQLVIRVGLSVNSPDPGKRAMLYDDVVCDLVR